MQFRDDFSDYLVKYFHNLDEKIGGERLISNLPEITQLFKPSFSFSVLPFD